MSHLAERGGYCGEYNDSMTEDNQILTVLVGSRAHGLETPGSDYDFRGVFIAPTSDILSLGAKPRTTSWAEGAEDDTSYELGHFLNLALHCNPPILEVFRGKVYPPDTPTGRRLLELFPSVWSSKLVADAFGGYSLNQRKKFLDDNDGRRWKYAVAYIRVLLQGIELLSTGDFHVRVQRSYQSSDSHLLCLSTTSDWASSLRLLRNGGMTVGHVIDMAEALRERLIQLAAEGPFNDKVADPEAVNGFLLEARKANW